MESADDCEDTDANIRPNGSEECNGADDNCDGIRDGDGVCPCAFDTRDGHSYLFCDGALDKVTWVVASRSCAEHGYQLVKIGDANENAWILATADSLVRSRWWIGANDRVDEGAWVWEDGTPLGFENWNDGEPNNIDEEDCAQLLGTDVGTETPPGMWNDLKCDEMRESDTVSRFVCEAG